MTIRNFKAFLYLFILFVCHQRTICRNWFSRSTLWVPEIELGFRGKLLYLWSLLAGLCGFGFFLPLFFVLLKTKGEKQSLLTRQWWNRIKEREGRGTLFWVNLVVVLTFTNINILLIKKKLNQRGEQLILKIQALGKLMLENLEFQNSQIMSQSRGKESAGPLWDWVCRSTQECLLSMQKGLKNAQAMKGQEKLRPSSRCKVLNRPW